MSEAFDAAVCANASLDDLSSEKILWFRARSRRKLGAYMPKSAAPQDVLERLHLLREGRPTNAAVILFGRDPQRLLALPPIKCLHFQGPTGATLLRHQTICDGTIFEWISQVTSFILHGITCGAPGRPEWPPYEIPEKVVCEAVLNALAHQDYSSTAGMQAALYSDRLEISNPGALPPSLTLDQLHQPHDPVPGNPLVAHVLYLNASVEGTGAGTTRMIVYCRSAGLPEPEFKVRDGFLVILHRPRHGPVGQPPGPPAGEGVGQTAPPPPLPVEPHLLTFLRLLAKSEPLSNAEILTRLGLKDRVNLHKRYLSPALEAGLIERTVPDKPHSNSQKYRLTANGRALLASSR